MKRNEGDNKPAGAAGKKENAGGAGGRRGPEQARLPHQPEQKEEKRMVEEELAQTEQVMKKMEVEVAGLAKVMEEGRQMQEWAVLNNVDQDH